MRRYDFDDYERLLEAASRTSAERMLLILIGAEAGLRLGEIRELKWSDIDFRRLFIKVLRSDWEGHVGLPKGGRSRIVPMTKRLQSALERHRHLRGPHVLCREDGSKITDRIAYSWMMAATKRAGLEPSGSVHALRHSFCSHLAMRGAPAKAIQELAGHKDLTTTMRYMHLSPAARDSAIRLLDQGREGSARGDIGETGATLS